MTVASKSQRIAETEIGGQEYRLIVLREPENSVVIGAS